MITVDKLRKEFKKTVKEPGLKGSVKSLFKPKSKKVIAVRDISFEVPKGEILGFIGPNGAGKSTVIKMLTGILTPTSGSCTINGKNPTQNRKNYVKEIGVVFGQRTQLWWDLPLRETYGVLKEIYEVPDDSYKKRMAFLNEVLELDDFISSPVRTLSLGQRMRADIAASLLHSPKVLFLDEPTIGLDAVSKKIVRDFILKINKERKVTVILTTHDMMDIDALAKRIILIGKGEILYDGSLSKLKTTFGSHKSIVVYTKNIIKDIKIDGIVKKEKQDEGYSFVIDSNILSISKFINYLSKNYEIDDMDIDNESIDNIILKLYQNYKI